MTSEEYDKVAEAAYEGFREKFGGGEYPAWDKLDEDTRIKWRTPAVRAIEAARVCDAERRYFFPQRAKLKGDD